MRATVSMMRPYPDPLRAYVDAVRSGDRRLAELIASRLFPWVRREPRDPSPAARRVVARLARTLRLIERD